MRPRSKTSKQKYEERKAKKQKTIMIYGATANKSTGNSKLIYHMAKAFQSGGHQVFTIGIDYNDITIWHDNIPILPAFSCKHMKKDENIQKIANWMNFSNPRPDYFICVGDPYIFQQYGVGNIEFKHIKALMYATIDSVLYDEPVLIKISGLLNLMKIGELIDNFFKIDILNRKEGVIPITNVEVPTFDEKFNVVWKPVDYVYRHKNKEQKYKVTTTNGLSIDLTASHSIFRTKIKKRTRTKNQKITVDIVKTTDLKKGEYLICPKNLDRPPNSIKYIKVYNLLKENNVAGLKDAPKDNRTKIEKNKFWINTCSFKKRIKIDSLLAKFFGWYVAEGCTNHNKIGSGRIDLSLNPHKDKQAIKICESICKRFSLKYYVNKKQENCISFQINSKPLALLLDVLFKRGAHNKRIPQILFNFPKKYIEAFIDAWIDGDYGSSVNKDLISDINYLGLLIGRRYSIYTLKRKGRKVTFNEPKGKREVILKNDVYQAICEKKNEGHKGLRSFRTRNDSAFLQIKDIKKIKYNKPYVYDLCVRGNNQFLSGKGGIFVHNSEGMFCNEELILLQKLPAYLDRCDRVISTAKFSQEQFKEWIDLDTDLIYEPINLENYKLVSAHKKIDIRKKYRFKKDDFIIYYAGRNSVRKRVFELLDGTIKFLCETKNTYLYLNIPVEGWVEQDQQNTPLYPDTLNPWDFIRRVMKKSHGRDLLSEGRIIFVQRGGLGSTDVNEESMAELYQLSDVYACATSGEGFGLPPAESMACGVPAIVPDNSTGREIIGLHEGDNLLTKHFIVGKGGLIVKTPMELYVDWGIRQKLTTPENIYQAIKHLYNKPELRKKLGEQGRKHVEEQFNLKTFTEKWLDIIKTTTKKDDSIEFKTMKLGGENDKKRV